MGPLEGEHVVDEIKAILRKTENLKCQKCDQAVIHSLFKLTEFKLLN